MILSKNMSNKQEKSQGGASDYGCPHYKRKCAFVSPCCQKVYSCRVCHNEKEKHEIDRHAIMTIICTECSTKQSVRKECSKCNICFGKYFCDVCRLYDDEDKGQFHCAGCGICRIGGRENFFHCERCNSCLSLTLKAGHKCIENASHSNCPVCLEDLHASRQAVEVPRCGHYIHRSCFKDMMKHGSFTCPLCGESYQDMKKLWDIMDKEVADTPMPDEYKDFQIPILCKDCHKTSDVFFHVIGLKCYECGSYNTCRASAPDDDQPSTCHASAPDDDQPSTESMSQVPPPPPAEAQQQSPVRDEISSRRQVDNESAEELLHV